MTGTEKWTPIIGQGDKCTPPLLVPLRFRSGPSPMATGTGKTFTVFQIIWRLWKAGKVRRVLFLVDRNILADQTMTNDFKPFGPVMTKVRDRDMDSSYEVYLALYQAVSGSEEEKNVYRQFSRGFFDLVVIDECHRGSAREGSAWREILDYFEPAIHYGQVSPCASVAYRP